MRRKQWPHAIEHLERARAPGADSFTVAVASYLEGWIHERMGHRAEAIAAYERANALAPRMRNLSVLLAVQLFLSNDRAAAYKILETGLNVDSPPFDLLTMFERADARLMPEYIRRMREALR